MAMDIGHLVALLRGTLQPGERVNAEKELIEVYIMLQFCENLYFVQICNVDCLLCVVHLSVMASRSFMRTQADPLYLSENLISQRAR